MNSYAYMVYRKYFVKFLYIILSIKLSEECTRSAQRPFVGLRAILIDYSHPILLSVRRENVVAHKLKRTVPRHNHSNLNSFAPFHQLFTLPFPLNVCIKYIFKVNVI